MRKLRFTLLKQLAVAPDSAFTLFSLNIGSQIVILKQDKGSRCSLSSQRAREGKGKWESRSPEQLGGYRQ